MRASVRGQWVWPIAPNPECFRHVPDSECLGRGGSLRVWIGQASFYH
jgi:hypothetical protein